MSPSPVFHIITGVVVFLVVSFPSIKHRPVPDGSQRCAQQRRSGDVEQAGRRLQQRSRPSDPVRGDRRPPLLSRLPLLRVPRPGPVSPPLSTVDHISET